MRKEKVGMVGKGEYYEKGKSEGWEGDEGGKGGSSKIPVVSVKGQDVAFCPPPPPSLLQRHRQKASQTYRYW